MGGAETMWSFIVDCAFCAIYSLELIFKILMLGVCGHFCGSTPVKSIFDACLVFLDLVQLVTSALPESSSVRGFKIFKLMRLAKLLRILRFLQSSITEDLLSMIQGLI